LAGTALPRRLSWQLGRVVELVDETARTKNIVLDVPDWQGHRAGQHVDVRLTAEDGYQAERSYSIASAPEDRHLVLTVERLRDGEVSPYLTDVLMPGDELELRGPIGGYFIWEEPLGGPLLLIADGSGVAPFARCCVTGRLSAVRCRRACCTRLGHSTISSIEGSYWTARTTGSRCGSR
jgi:ferredoxin-NADP reductase